MQQAASIYRQVNPKAGNPIHVDPSRKHKISSAVFMPSPADTDGLSLICALLMAYDENKCELIGPFGLPEKGIHPYRPDSFTNQ